MLTRLTARFGKGLILVGLLVVLTILKTWPLVFQMRSSIHFPPEAALLNSLILTWDVHSLMHQPGNLFNLNIFFPVNNTLAFSENLLGVVPIFAPFYLVSHNPILASNVVFVLSFLLCGLAMYFLVYDWTGNFWSAIVSSVLFAFAPVRFTKLNHFHLLNLYAVTLAFLFLERFFTTRSWKNLILFSLFFYLQVWQSINIGWMSVITLGLYAFYHFFRNRKILKKDMLLKGLVFALLSILVLGPLWFPYHRASVTWGFTRTLDECIAGSAHLKSYLYAPSLMNDFYKNVFRFPLDTDYALFPGFLLPFLAALAYLPKRFAPLSKKMTRMREAFSFILCSSFVLSLGPFLILKSYHFKLPLPYLVFYYALPGFQSFRSPERFSFMVVFAASVIASIGFLRLYEYFEERWRQKAQRRTVALILSAFCISLFLIELGFKPIPLMHIPIGSEVPQVYQWLSLRQPGPIIEFPFAERGQEDMYLYFGNYHFLPMVSGYSGFVPPTYWTIAAEMQGFPTGKKVEYLRRIGVRAVILHTALFCGRSRQDLELAFLRSGLKKEAAFQGGDVAYSIPPTPSDFETLPLKEPSMIIAALPSKPIYGLTDTLIFRTVLVNRSAEHRVDIYCAIKNNKGRLFLYDGVKLIPFRGKLESPVNHALFVARNVQLGGQLSLNPKIAVRLKGNNIWRTFVTEMGSQRVLAFAATPFCLK